MPFLWFYLSYASAGWNQIHLLEQEEYSFPWDDAPIAWSKKRSLHRQGGKIKVTVTEVQTCSSSSQTETTAHRKRCRKGDRKEISWRQARTVKSLLEFKTIRVAEIKPKKDCLHSCFGETENAKVYGTSWVRGLTYSLFSVFKQVLL